MELDDFASLRCPVTGSRLNRIDDRTLEAQEGGQRYPVVHGIPDFRLFDPPYMSREDEYEIVDRLVSEARHCNYEELVCLLERELMPAASAEQIEKGVRHRLKLIERAPTRLWGLVESAGGIRISDDGVVLDLGCGSGEAIRALFELGASKIIGLDISLIELAMAKKLLEEQGVQAFLVAGCAEALPFASEIFAFVYSPDVIEHVVDQQKYLEEARRVLQVEGQVLLNSPNRYSIVCPEPHVGVWGLTFLPRPWVDPVCRFLGKGPYIGKRLVSLPELRRLVQKNFSQFEIFSRGSNPQATSLVGRAYHALSPLSVRAYAYIADQHVVLLHKRG